MTDASDLFLLDRTPCLRSPPPIPGPLDFSGFRVLEEIAASDCADSEADWAADDFFVCRRMSTPSASIEFSWARPVDAEGLRVARFESDSDSDEQQIVAVGADPEEGGARDPVASGDLGPPLRWDCPRLGENRRDLNEEFEWEEVDGRIDERDAFGVTVIGDEERSEEIRDLDHDDGENEEDGAQWQVLLAVNSLGRNPMDTEDVEAYFIDEQEGFVYTSDNEAYEVLFGQFAEQDSNIKGTPPAAKSVIESLPSVIFTHEDVSKDDAVCAVCKDGTLVEERVKRLPCSHLYHEECILPWLGIRNTCPLCRFELPTDDPEYEKWKARRASRDVSNDDLQLRVNVRRVSNQASATMGRSSITGQPTFLIAMFFTFVLLILEKRTF